MFGGSFCFIRLTLFLLIQVPWTDVKYILAGIMYGGHITDYWDRRCNTTYLVSCSSISLRVWPMILPFQRDWWHHFYMFLFFQKIFLGRVTARTNLQRHHVSTRFSSPRPQKKQLQNIGRIHFGKIATGQSTHVSHASKRRDWVFVYCFREWRFVAMVVVLLLVYWSTQLTFHFDLFFECFLFSVLCSSLFSLLLFSPDRVVWHHHGVGERRRGRRGRQRRWWHCFVEKDRWIVGDFTRTL